MTSRLPVGASLGKILAVGAKTLMAISPDGEFGVYGVDEVCDYAWRMIQVGGGGLCELTHWADGKEVRRYLVHGHM